MSAIRGRSVRHPVQPQGMGQLGQATPPECQPFVRDFAFKASIMGGVIGFIGAMWTHRLGYNTGFKQGKEAGRLEATGK